MRVVAILYGTSVILNFARKANVRWFGDRRIFHGASSFLFCVTPAPLEAFASRKRLRVRAKISLHPEAPGVSRASKDESEYKAAGKGWDN